VSRGFATDDGGETMGHTRSLRRISPVLLVALASWAAGSGCQMGQKTHASAQPRLVVRYPASWTHVEQPGPGGTVEVFSPDRRPGPASPRVTMEITAAEVRAKVIDQMGKPAVMVEQFLGEQENGLRGQRWFVTVAPLAVIVEAYGAAGKFGKIREVGARMANDILRQSAEMGGRR